MRLRRFLRTESIRLELETRLLPEPATRPDGTLEELDLDDFDPDSPVNRRRIVEGVLGEIAELFDATGEVSNLRKLERELFERERKAVTAVGSGIAIPHVRTLQVKTFLMAFARSTEGLPFNAPDDEPVHIFIGLAAPPYDDRTYLKVYRELARNLIDSTVVQDLLSATDPSEVLLAFKDLED